MFVIAGLGNPGEQYKQTRHNVGFMVVDRLNEQFNGSFKKGKGSYFLSKVTVESYPALLVKPITYMNLSGQAIRQVIDFYKIEDLSKLLIIVDDFHLQFGTIRLRPSGSAAGQKGLISILQNLKTDQIARLRIGIGDQFRDAVSFVLNPFSKSEQKQLPDVIDWAASAAESFITRGIEKTMNTHNRNILDS